MVLYDRPTKGSAELIALEWRSLPGFKEVCRVELAVANEFVPAAVDLIRPGSRDRVDHSAGGLSVLRRVVAGDDRELLDRVNAQASAQHTPRCSIGVVIEADAVQTVVVLLRTRARDGELLPEAAVAAIGTRGKVGLGVDGAHASLEFCQIGPTAAVEGKFTNRGGVHHGTDVGSGDLHSWHFALNDN